MLALITGGAASGKSELAERLAVACGGRMAYLATMRLWDDECRARAEKHRAMRAGKGFETVECPFGDLGGMAGKSCDTALLEDLSNLAANVMFSNETRARDPAALIAGKLEAARAAARNLIIVTNEIFSDTGGYDEATLRYIRLLGGLNRALGAAADIVAESVCGIPVFYKGKERAEKYENIF